MKTNEKVLVNEVEKIYPVRSNRIDKNGNKYVYCNYITFIKNDFLKLMGIGQYMYLYYIDNKVYLTSEQPDGSVAYKRIRVNMQQGSKTSKKYNKDNDWKRFFTIPKRFFPYVDEHKEAFFLLDPSKKDLFSDVPARLSLQLRDKE